ncbi:MAG: peptide chain release factor 2 [Candidatus Parcubacteria bacterium]|nr:peptide chain release factor 2 [Candidatus Parcubacteria bacterium]
MKESELVSKIKELQRKIRESWGFLEIDKKMAELKDLEVQMGAKDFWQDQNQAKAVSQKASDLKNEIVTWQKIKQDIEELLEMAQLDAKDQSVDFREEIEGKYSELEKKFGDLEFYLLFSGKHDKNNAILAIHAGTGGVDAMDWAEMLLRMYLRYCDQKGFKTEIIDKVTGSEAGIKSVVIEVRGSYAFGNLKSEHGVHRLVRISPFDAEAMRHTSFALVEVIPEIEEDLKIEIRSEDLRIDTFRASGHGGQNVQKTETAVRITHLPSKIVVTCQTERSQVQNKERAMKILKSKLQVLAETKAEADKKQLRGEFTEAVWGNQIRSYILQPYHLVKDHRTEFEESDVEGVLDGKLNGFVEAFLKMKSEVRSPKN